MLAPVTERPVLYVIPGSHPCAAVEEAMRRKGVEFKRVDLLPMMNIPVVLLRCGGTTVPALRLGSERLCGSRRIMRFLDELHPDPPLLPPVGTEDYARVLELERWGDIGLQDATRRILDAAILRRPQHAGGYLEGARLPMPKSLIDAITPATARLMIIKNHAGEDSVRADLAALPAQLDRIDSAIADGLLGGEDPNAADLQLGSSLRLLLTIADLRPLIEPRPCARLAGYFPPQPGGFPAGTFPADWLPAEVGVQI
jgi:glutathione S-transferase